VARSKCYLLLGEPRLALTDAEMALKLDPKHAKALLQKAEALYYCGEFEMSLVFYHRGLRARPDLIEFRLGVQKAQVKSYFLPFDRHVLYRKQTMFYITSAAYN
jgi:tetratricopeptide (TPR) repeat protein